MLIEVCFLLTFCIDKVIGQEFTYHWNYDFHLIHKNWYPRISMKPPVIALSDKLLKCGFLMITDHRFHYKWWWLDLYFERRLHWKYQSHSDYLIINMQNWKYLLWSWYHTLPIFNIRKKMSSYASFSISIKTRWHCFILK